MYLSEVQRNAYGHCLVASADLKEETAVERFAGSAARGLVGQVRIYRLRPGGRAG